MIPRYNVGARVVQWTFLIKRPSVIDKLQPTAGEEYTRLWRMLLHCIKHGYCAR